MKMGVLYYKNRVCVPDDNDLRKVILEEAHNGSFAIHPGSTKMYQDLKNVILVVRNEKRYIRVCN